MFHGIRVPSPVALTWLDDGTLWLVVTLDDVAYSVDIRQALRAAYP
jgi:hypothetical protein